MLAKQLALPFNSSTSHAKSLFDLIHVDVWGPYKHTTVNKCKYFLTIVDDYSRATWTYLMPTKQHTTTHIKAFYQYVLTHFQVKIKTVRSDNRTEFLNSTLTTFFQSVGIFHQTSCPNTPQQNASVERKHKQLLEVARALKFQANFPIHFWGYCILTATYLINRLPSTSIQNKSPYELLHKSPPTLDHIRTIGCRAFVHHHTPDKSAHRSIPAVLIGYSPHQKGYLLYDPQAHKVLTSRHVDFDETIFPFHKSPDIKTSTTTSNTQIYPQNLPFFSPQPANLQDNTPSSSDPILNATDVSTPTPAPSSTPQSHTDYTDPTPTQTTPIITDSSPSTSSTSIPLNPPPPPLRTSHRVKTIPAKLKDFKYTLPKSNINTVSKHHFTNFINYSNVTTPMIRHLINTINKTIEPTTYK